MTSDAQARPQEDDDVTTASSPTTPAPTPSRPDAPDGPTRRPGRARRATGPAGRGPATRPGAGPAVRCRWPGARPSCWSCCWPPRRFLWFTRPDTSAVRTADYVGALQAARSGVVDLTSFDYLTLDDDIAQIKRGRHR